MTKRDAIKELYASDEDTRRFFGNMSSDDVEHRARTLEKISDALCNVGKAEVKAELLDEFSEILSKVATRDDLERMTSVVMKKVENLEHNDRRQDARLDKLEHQATNSAITLDHVNSNAKQIPQLLDSINACYNAINSLHDRANAEKPKTPSQQSIMQKVPVQVWTAVLMVATGISVYIATGDSSILKLLGFGVGK